LFSSKPLPSKYIGKEIGLFKDELKGKTIQKVIFLGPKRYGIGFMMKIIIELKISICRCRKR